MLTLAIKCEEDFEFQACKNEEDVKTCEDILNKDQEGDVYYKNNIFEGCFLQCKQTEAIQNDKCVSTEACMKCFDEEKQIYREVCYSYFYFCTKYLFIICLRVQFSV